MVAVDPPFSIVIACSNLGFSCNTNEPLDRTRSRTACSGSEQHSGVIGSDLAGVGDLSLESEQRHLLDELGWSYGEYSQLILGGPLMGFTLDQDASLGKTSNCVIAPTPAELPPPPAEAPCIRCGQCDSVCPAQLLPQQLFWHAKAQENTRLLTHNLFDCIECGACSYVCPSTIPLVHYYRHAKADIRAQQEVKLKADHARRRFEAHQARIEQQEADKQAKRTSRQAAAVAVQAQLDSSATAAPAVAEQSAEYIAAKLQRHRQSAQERLDRLKQQLAEEADPARQE
ncbi:MAG: 4Fe-4S dicluster domain-containing protein, partial [Sphingobacteriales bacterium]